MEIIIIVAVVAMIGAGIYVYQAGKNVSSNPSNTTVDRTFSPPSSRTSSPSASASATTATVQTAESELQKVNVDTDIDTALDQITQDASF